MRSESQYGCRLVRHVAVCVCVRSALPLWLCAKERSAFIRTENLVSGLFEKVFFFPSCLRKQKGQEKSSALRQNKRREITRSHKYFKKQQLERLRSKNLETSLCKSPDSCEFWVYALRARVCVYVCHECYYSCTISCLEVVRPEVRYWWQPDMQREIKTEGEDCGGLHRRTTTTRHVDQVRLQ